MRTSDLKKYVGKVAILDTVSGQQWTTKVNKVFEEDGREYAELDKIVLFIINPQTQNVHPVPYGAPLFEVEGGKVIDITNFVMAHDPLPDMEKVYIDMTRSIQIVGAGALGDLPASKS